jgi:branched-chain amino acid transport system substrate-binding protein
MRTLIKTAFLLVVVALVVVACGGGGSSQGGSETIKIGSLHPLTGPLAVDGKRMDQAVKMAVKDINDAGGIESMDGAKLEVVSGDTKGEPETASSEAQRMTGEGAVALVGPYTSATAATVARAAERAQVPFVIDVATADSLLNQGYTYTFRIQPGSESMGQFGARYLKDIAEEQGSPVESVVYIHESSEFGTSVFDAFAEEAQKEGIEVTREISYDALNVSDLTSELTQAKAANPDVIVATGYYNDGLLLAKAAADVRPDVKAVYGVANGAFDLETFPEDAGENGNYYLSSNYHFDATSDRAQELQGKFEEQTGESMRTAAVFSYQAVEVIADALERAGSSEPPELRDAIAETSLETELFPFDGPIEFDNKGQNVNAQPIVMQVQDAEVVQVYPEDFAQGEPQFPAVPWNEGQQ